MAEAAGLVLGVIGVSGLFSACIGGFHVVISGKDFSEDYEQLCALFSLQRARFGLWGESVGLVPSPHDGRKLRYDKNLDRPDIRPGVERILNNIKLLLEEAGKVDERYGSGSGPPNSHSLELSSPKGLDIFKVSFDRWKSRLRKQQKDTSTWHVTRWAVHDAEKFEGIISRLKDFVDGLESITKSLGLLEEQHARLRQEIESISDTESLRLLRDASSRHGTSEHDVSDTASRRLDTIAGSISESQTAPSGALSFATARTKHTGETNSLSEFGHLIPGAWPKSLKSETRSKMQSKSTGQHQEKIVPQPNNKCTACLGEHHKDTPISYSEAYRENFHALRECSFTLEDLCNQETDSNHTLPEKSLGTTAIHGSLIPEIPQNQRLLSDLVLKAKPRSPLSFKQGDANYGERLKYFKKEDESFWLEHSGTILSKANSGSSAAKRMFFELRNIRVGKVPFVTAAPLDDSLDRVLASIEGPPETPYEGGVFWLTIKLPENDPFGPPLMRFQTKIYHPNISPQGHICADYKDKWNAVLAGGSQHPPVTALSGSWYQKKSSNFQWSLGALLTALCGLLASPDVDDPLVPEIAQTYVEDYKSYYHNAKLYTKLYATTQRPSCESLVFLDEIPLPATVNGTTISIDPSSVAHSVSKISSSDDGHMSDSEATASLNRVTELRLQPEESMWTHSVNGPKFRVETAGFFSPESPLPLFQLWKVLVMSRGKLEESVLHDSTKGEQALQNLVALCRAQPGVACATRDIDIVWLLLKKANLVLEGKLSPPGGLQLEVKQFYTLVKNTCERRLFWIMQSENIRVWYAKDRDEIRFSFGSSNGSSLGWQCSKTWRSLRKFQKKLETSTLKLTPLWRLDGHDWRRHSTKANKNLPPDPVLMGHLLAYSLRRFLRTHDTQILSGINILKAFRPKSSESLRKRDRRNRKTLNLSYVESLPARLTNICSFIPPSLFERTKVMLQNSGGKSKDNCYICLVWEKDQNVRLEWQKADSSRTFSTDVINLKNLRASYLVLCFQIPYFWQSPAAVGEPKHSQSLPDLRSNKKDELIIRFEKNYEMQLWFETLELYGNILHMI